MSEGAVGVVGLGAMGLPMAVRLAEAGYEVVAYDVRAERMAAAPQLRAAAGVRQVVEAVDEVVISMVRTLPETEDVAEAVDRDGVLLIVMSTVDPSALARIDRRLGARGVALVDAPVSGGVAGAEAGTLAIMVAGPPATIDRVRPLLHVLGTSIFVVGDQPGTGQAVKLANQLMLAVNMLGVFEGTRLAREHGMESYRVLPVIAASTGDSWVAEHWETVLGWWRDYQPGGPLDIIYKDLRSLLGDAAQRQVSLPVTALAFHLLHEVWKREG